ncbi:MAG: ion transporter [Candidatus Eremiobacteraeota bacterium]|nr:ion transporter [Candidatus Eremiobacteraeota bacterium]MCW5871946.1 ion transporter [Candidatus Eremiobacteraeota bacterium]
MNDNHGRKPFGGTRADPLQEIGLEGRISGDMQSLSSLSRVCQRIQAHSAFDVSVAILIVINLALLFPEIALPRLDSTRLAIGVVQETITALFCLELAVRFLAMGKPRRFLREYWIDILAVVPVLRAFRIFRFLKLLRLFRLFRLVRILGKRTRLTRRLFRYGGGEYILLGFFLAFAVSLGALGLTWFESAHSGYSTIENSFWSALFSTVSAEYITSYPQTLGGKVMVFLLELAGLCLFAVLTGTASVYLIEKLREGTNMGSLYPEDLEGHVLVCGWNTGSAATLARLQRHPDFREKAFVLIAEREDFTGIRQLPLPDQVVCLREDFTRAEVLRKANVAQAAVALLFCDNSRGSRQDADARTVLAALTIDKLNPRVHTCAELSNSGNEHHLSMAHVREVVVTQDLSGHLLAQAALNSSNARLFHQLLKADNIQAVAVDEKLAGKKFAECVCELATSQGLIVLAVQEAAGELHINPGGREVAAGETLLCLSRFS